MFSKSEKVSKGEIVALFYGLAFGKVPVKYEHPVLGYFLSVSGAVLVLTCELSFTYFS